MSLFEQHEEIFKFLSLKDKFKRYIEKQNQDFDIKGLRLHTFTDYKKKALIRHFKLIGDSYGVSLGELIFNKKIKDRGDASRMTKKLNYFLRAYSCDKNIESEHPIQVFSYHEDPEKISETSFHFACAKTEIFSGNKTYSTDNITLEKAIERGKAQFIAAKQEASVKLVLSSEALECNIKEFCEKLKKEAMEHIDEKLHGRGLDDYRSLELEIGFAEGDSNEEKEFYYDPETHNRVWEEFNHDELKNPQGIYILSSEVGSGKTTFLRKLQLTIIENTELIPIFIEASRIDRLAFMERDTEDFLISVGKLVNRNPKNDFEEDFLITHQDRIVFLIDGLDQIKGTGSEYEILIDKLLGVIKDKIIIASRPFAVTEQERDQNIKFLALNPFGEVDVQAYFEEKYKCAKELCRTCPEMIHVPMLAYMVRCLIEDGDDQYIKNRTGLYTRFINGVFEKYRHENLKVSIEKRAKIKKAYEEISFKAIANNVPYLQKIPFLFAIDCKGNDIEIDDLFKYGIANTIINRTRATKMSIYFSHQSFQEYLAAEYISQDDDLIQKVLSEKWNPKWKEVIKFIVGINGQEIIEKILDEKDNPIHSKLFFCAELVSEVEINSTLRKKISQKIEILFEDPVFVKDAEKYWLYIDKEKALNRLVVRLKDKDPFVRQSYIETLGDLKDKVDSGIIKKIIDTLEDENSKVRNSAISTLGKLSDMVDSEIIKKIVGQLEDKSSKVRGSAISVLGKLTDRIDSEIIKKIVGKLEDENSDVRCSAVSALGKLNDKADSEIIKNITDKLEDKSSDVRCSAISALVELRDKVNSEIIKKIVDKLEDKSDNVREKTISVITLLRDRVDSGVAEKVTEKVLDKYETMNVRWGAVYTLGQLRYKVTDEIIEKIVDKLEDKSVEIRRSTISALGKLNDRLDSEIVKKIVDKLEDKNIEIRDVALFALGDMKDKVDCKIIKKIVGKLDDKNRGIRGSAISALGKLNDKLDAKIVKNITDKLEDDDINWISIPALGKMGNKVDREIVKKIAEKLEDKFKDKWLRITAESALEKLKDKIDSEIAKKIVSIKNEEAVAILKVLYQDGKLEFLNGA